MHLRTCVLPDCLQPEKHIPYSVLIGRSTWNTYETVRSCDDEKIAELGLPLYSLQYLTRFALSWSYILCCRWVEILQSTGEEAAILRPEIGDVTDFWEMIHNEQWRATVNYNGAIYYAPFMLRGSSMSVPTR
jgi:hypothetical protein